MLLTSWKVECRHRPRKYKSKPQSVEKLSPVQINFISVSLSPRLSSQSQRQQDVLSDPGPVIRGPASQAVQRRPEAEPTLEAPEPQESQKPQGSAAESPGKQVRRDFKPLTSYFGSARFFFNDMYFKQQQKKSHITYFNKHKTVLELCCSWWLHIEMALLCQFWFVVFFRLLFPLVLDGGCAAGGNFSLFLFCYYE